jgi:pyruvate dehydrogenase E2 component (dihydrolipoamide acetyltransferase)
MARSHSTIPHVTNFDDADITELERIRKGSMADYVDKNVKLTMMAFVMKAVAHALKLHPAVNGSIDLEKGEAIYKQYVNLGVAVVTDRGLVVPVMRSVDRMSIPQIAGPHEAG